MRKFQTLARSILPLGAALALAACGGETEQPAEEAAADEPTYETDVEDMSGGELIVNEVDPEAVEVDTPDTPMVPHSPEGEDPPE